MRESEIALACARWLERDGYDVHGEVTPKAYVGRFDLVGLKRDEVVVVETKVGYTHDLRMQLLQRERFAHRLFAGIPWRSRPLGAPYLGGPGYYTAALRHGVLYVEGDEVFVARPAPPLPGERVSIVRAACGEWTRGKPGGVVARGRDTVPTPYRTLVWEIHRRLAPHADGLPFPDACALVEDLLRAYEYRVPRSELQRIFDREDCFDVEWNGHRWANAAIHANGHGVPDSCRATPRPTEPVERHLFPRRVKA